MEWKEVPSKIMQQEQKAFFLKYVIPDLIGLIKVVRKAQVISLCSDFEAVKSVQFAEMPSE